MMESFVRTMTRAPAVLNVNDMSNSEEKNLNAQLDTPDVVGKIKDAQKIFVPADQFQSNLLYFSFLNEDFLVI